LILKNRVALKDFCYFPSVLSDQAPAGETATRSMRLSVSADGTESGAKRINQNSSRSSFLF
jgi:hypothetical protein